MPSLASRVRTAANDAQIGTPGNVSFASQRLNEPAPFTNCRMFSTLMLLRFMGLKLPASFALVLRKASGVPETDSKGKPLGTTSGDVLRALERTLPSVPLEIAPIPDAELLEGIRSGQFIASPSCTYGLLPTKLRRLSPNFTGGHQIVIAGVRARNGGQQVLWLDPLGGRGYQGEWVNWSAVRPALWTSQGDVIAMIGRRGAALGSLLFPTRTFTAASAFVARGTPLFRVDPVTLSLERDGSANAGFTASVDWAGTSAKWPKRPPQGAFVHLTDGRLVRAGDVTVIEAPPQGDTALLQARIAELETQLAIEEPWADFGREVDAIPAPGAEL